MWVAGSLYAVWTASARWPTISSIARKTANCQPFAPSVTGCGGPVQRKRAAYTVAKRAITESSACAVLPLYKRLFMNKKKQDKTFRWYFRDRRRGYFVVCIVVLIFIGLLPFTVIMKGLKMGNAFSSGIIFSALSFCFACAVYFLHLSRWAASISRKTEYVAFDVEGFSFYFYKRAERMLWKNLEKIEFVEAYYNRRRRYARIIVHDRWDNQADFNTTEIRVDFPYIFYLMMAIFLSIIVIGTSVESLMFILMFILMPMVLIISLLVIVGVVIYGLSLSEWDKRHYLPKVAKEIREAIIYYGQGDLIYYRDVHGKQHRK